MTSLASAKSSTLVCLLAGLFGLGSLPSLIPAAQEGRQVTTKQGKAGKPPAKAQKKAADLSKIPRNLTTEPKYQSKSPRYCLLAFGPKAEHRIWIVLDGNRLFVDRNSDGKLSEEGEVVLGKPRIGGREIAGKSTLFLIGELKTGKLTHRNVHLTTDSLSALPKAVLQDPLLKKPYQQDPIALIYQLLAEVEMPGFTGNQEGGRVLRMAYMDGSNLLQFAASPKNAPIVHMGGTSFQAVLLENKSFTAGKEADITVVIGSPGLGQGTCAMLAYEKLIPYSARPVLEITWPKKSKDAPSLVTKHILYQRC